MAFKGRTQGPYFDIGGGLAKMDTKPRAVKTVYIVCLTIWFPGLATAATVASLLSADLSHAILL